MSALVYILIGVAVLLLAAIIYYFNRMIKLRNKVRRAWKDIDVQLKKRHDLVPLLVRVAEGYSLHERKVLESVTEKRSEAQAASGARAIGDKERILTIGLNDIFLLREEYPDLKADSAFQELSDELVKVEDHIAASRKYYNGSVRIYNTYIESFPQMLFARPFRFLTEEYFQIELDEKESPTLEGDE
jgi:LemA protein